MKKLIQRIVAKLGRRKFVKDYKKFCTEKVGHALVYYKTETLIVKSAREDYSHTNNMECYEMVKILNKMGLWVDMVDRTATPEDFAHLEDKYDIFIGLGAGDSGRYFPDIAAKIPSAIKVLYAMGPEPDLSDRVTRDRHNYFRKRHPEYPVVDRRLVSAVDTDRLYKMTDAIITIGNEFSFGSYEHLGKELHKIYFSTYSELRMGLGDLAKKNKKKFLYFGGSGNILKGLDLTLEAFEKNPDLELYIGAPAGEEDFNAFANPIIERCKNIHRLGFVDVKGELFRKVTAECGFVIMLSASEGAATSMTTCMRRGLIPVATIEDGLELGDYGYLISDIDPDKLALQIKEISNVADDEFKRRVLGTYAASGNYYTLARFSQSLEEAFWKILARKNFLIKS
jgi:hypothetical protein